MSSEQVQESMLELRRLSKVSIVGMAGIYVVIILFERFVMPEASGIANGFLLGSLCSLANLHILGRTFAPIVHTGKRGTLAVFGAICSFLVMAAGLFLVFVWYKHLLLGVALGIASPALFGFLYAAFSSPSRTV